MAKPNGSFHSAAKATEAAAPETTEATTAASRRIAGRPSPRRYEPTREDAMVAFAKGWRREGVDRPAGGPIQNVRAVSFGHSDLHCLTRP
jgi:hypothetical protein